MMGVLPVRIGEILQHILGKCILQACGEGVAHACDVEQLCSGLWGGIEGGVHATTSLWADQPDSNALERPAQVVSWYWVWF